MAALSTQTVANVGTELQFSPASPGGDTCPTGSDVKLLVNNASGAPITVTLVTPGTVDGNLAITDRTVTVNAGKVEAIPVTDLYRNPSTGLASLTYSATATVTVAVMR